MLSIRVSKSVRVWVWGGEFFCWWGWCGWMLGGECRGLRGEQLGRPSKGLTRCLWSSIFLELFLWLRFERPSPNLTGFSGEPIGRNFAFSLELNLFSIKFWSVLMSF